MKKQHSIVIKLTFIFVLLNNNRLVGQEIPDLDFKSVDRELANYGTVKWESRWDHSVISVCWLDFSQSDAEHRDLVRTAVANSWERNSGLRLVGWQQCKPGSSGIKIQVDESNPRSAVGRESEHQSPSMWLNFAFNSWSPACKDMLRSCITSIAVHEFGHAIGFQHEQLQPDAPKECVDDLKRRGEWEGATSNTPLTTYDEHSVMNYCNAVYNNSGNLSSKDVKAVQILFPKV